MDNQPQQAAGTSELACSDFRCATCKSRNSHSGKRVLEDESVIYWFCPNKGCENHEDNFDPNPTGHAPARSAAEGR